MAVSLDDPLLWGGVFVAVFLLELAVVATLRKQVRSGAYERPTKEAVLAEGEELTDVLSRFVDDVHGNRLGETVGMDGSRVIVKEPGATSYLAVERAVLRRTEGGDFHLAAEIDKDTARQDGEAWRERSHKVVEYSSEELPEDERA